MTTILEPVNKYQFALDLQFFADGGGDGKNDDDDMGGDGGKDGGGADDDKGGGEGSAGKTKTFTQDDLERIIADRLARERKKFDGVDEKLAKLAELEAAEAERKKAEMSLQERLEAEKAEAEKQAQEAAEKAEQALKAANQRVIDAEIRSIARSLNAADPNDVLALLDKSAVKIDDEGNVIGAEDVVKAFKEAKPHLFKAAMGADAGGGSNPSKNPNKSEIAALEAEYAELQQKARKDRKLFGQLVALGNKIAELKRK